MLDAYSTHAECPDNVIKSKSYESRCRHEEKLNEEFRDFVLKFKHAYEGKNDRRVQIKQKVTKGSK